MKRRKRKTIKQKVKTVWNKVFDVFLIMIVVVFFTVVFLVIWPAEVEFSYTLPIDITYVWVRGLNDISVIKDELLVEIISISDINYNYTPYYLPLRTKNMFTSGEKIKLKTIRNMYPLDTPNLKYEYDLVVPVFTYTVPMIQRIIGLYFDFDMPEGGRQVFNVTDVEGWKILGEVR